MGNDPVNAIDPSGMSREYFNEPDDLDPTTDDPASCGCDGTSMSNSDGSDDDGSDESGSGDNLPSMDEGSAEPSSDNLPQSPESRGSTKHGEERAQEAKTDPNRQVGDGNKVLENGKKYTDTETGNTVHVDGNRVVIVNEKGERVTQFKNTKANTSDRIRSGRWEPR